MKFDFRNISDVFKELAVNCMEYEMKAKTTTEFLDMVLDHQIAVASLEDFAKLYEMHDTAVESLAIRVEKVCQVIITNPDVLYQTAEGTESPYIEEILATMDDILYNIASRRCQSELARQVIVSAMIAESCMR